jgi:hypothetical protein
MKHLTGILGAAFLFTAAGAASAQQKVTERPWKQPKNGVLWEKSFEDAQEKAKRENKPILLYQLVGDLTKEGC